MATTELKNIITQEVIDGVNSVNVLTDRVAKRKQECLDATPHLSSQRSLLVTESWRETEGEPLALRRAKLFKKVMEGIAQPIWDGELIVGSQTEFLRGGHPAVDYSVNSLKATLEAEKITLSGEVTEGILTEEERKDLLGVLEYWDGKAPGDVVKRLVLEKIQIPFDDWLEAHLFSDAPFATPIAGRITDYHKIMTMGLSGLRDKVLERMERLGFDQWGDMQKYDFLQSLLICIDAVIAYAGRYANEARAKAAVEKDPARRRELEQIAETCDWVPANPPRTFREALQSVWFMHLAADFEAPTGGEPLGRFDQFLYPFYESDLQEGRMTRQEAAELMGCLWIKLCETETIYSLHDRQIGQGSNFQDLTIGGVTRDGEDATNELSFMVLEVTRQLKVNQPPIYIRVHECMNEDILIKAVETNRDHGAGMPAFMNDAPTLTKLMERDVPLEDAREWICGGCIIPMVPSGSTSDPGFMFNRVKAFEMVLYNGVDQRTGKLLGVQTGDPREFKSYDELYQAYLTQLEYIAAIVRKTWHITQQLRSELFYMPFGSLTIDDCIERGKGILQGGMRFPGLKGDYADVGHQNAADSLTAIKTLVFDEKKLTMDELLEALKTNFEGHEDVQRLLLSAPKYGNDDDVADDIFNTVSLDASRIMAAPDLDGRPMHIARGGASQHYWAGNTVGALPDGRLAWQPTADANLSPVQGADVNGPTAVLLSATKTNHQKYAMTTLLNLKVMPSMVKSRDGICKLLSLNDAYFKRGGWHVQYNMIDPSILAAAKKDPQKHRDLVVRVAGYSAYFVDLTPKVQNEIIARTEHRI